MVNHQRHDDGLNDYGGARLAPGSYTDESVRRQWISTLGAALKVYPRWLMKLGKALTGRIAHLEPDSAGVLTCICQDFNGLCETVEFLTESEEEFADPIEVACSCEEYDEFQQCPHAYAATLELRNALLNYIPGVTFNRAGQSPGNRMPFVDNRAVQRAPAPPAPPPPPPPARKPWELLFAEIDRCVDLSGKGRLFDAPPPPVVRMAWRIEVTERTITATPVEQTYNAAKDKWSKGRRIAWERYVRERSLWATPADEKIAVLACHAYIPYREPELIDVLPHLVGHPHVLLVLPGLADRHGKVCRGQASLKVLHTPEGLHLVPLLSDHPVDEFLAVMQIRNQWLVGCLESRSELHIAPLSARAVQLFSVFSTMNTTIPHADAATLLARLPTIERELPVHLPDQMLADAAPADSRIRVQLSPLSPAGLSVLLRVQPGVADCFFPPGEGAPTSTTMKDGRPARVIRNLAEEAAQASQLVQNSALASRVPSGPWKWSVLDDEAALDLVSFLQVQPAEAVVVEWANGSRPAISVLGELTPNALKVQIKDRRDWFGLEGTFELGDQKFPLVNLLSALRSGSRYVQMGEGQFALIAQEFRDRLTRLGDVLHKSRSTLDFDLTAAPVVAEFLDDAIDLRAAQTWKKTLKRLDEVAQLDPHPPMSLTAELRDYQLEGYCWLRRLAAWGVGGCLADDMGLGKTVQALAVLIDRMEKGPALVVAPVSVGFNWVRESERFAPTLRPILYRDTDRGEFLDTLGNGDVVVTSYGLVLRDAEKLKKIKWGTLILDEAQFIKNSQTKTAQVVRDLQADWRLALTGTPVENHLGELWSIFRAVAPGLFGSWERFRERFAEPIERRKDAGRRHALAGVIRPFVLRRTKSEVLTELPQRTEVLLTAELSPAERKLYEDARLWAVTHLTQIADDTEDNRFQVLAALTRLRQMACHPRLIDPAWTASSAKLDLFLETVEELRDGRHRALVFSQFTQHLALVRAALDERQVPYQYLDGATTAKQRQQRVDAFQHGAGDLFLISLKAGGTGLNLTAADYVIHLDPWWNPAVEDQATDRAHRIGQTRPVTVYRLVAKDTIEEQILALHAEKRQLVASVLDGSDQAAKLSSHELVDLIKYGGRSPAASR